MPVRPSIPRNRAIAPARPSAPTAGDAGRLDTVLVRRGLVASRERAKEAVAAGQVFVNGAPATKPSTPVGPDDAVELRGATLRYVGRGGLKLERALEVFGLRSALDGARCVDIGASTGGFTDCMLQAGAARVCAVDVGHGQLDARLVANPRVTNLEGTDARSVEPEQIGGAVDFAATDVSFISLAHILPAMARLLRAGGTAVCLVKPQFEAGRELVGKRGIVKDPAVHRDVIERVLGQARAVGLEPRGLDFSPITGGEGNIEYLLYAVKRAQESSGADDIAGETGSPIDVAATVAAAHAALRR